MYKDEPKPPKGGGKKKGVAKESMAVPAEKLETIQNTEGGGRKKGGAAKPKQKRKEDKLKKTAKQLADPDTNLKDFSRKLTKYKKTKKQIKEIKGGAKHIDGKEHGAANYEDGYPPAGSGKKKGASKKKGSADFKGGLHAKNTKHSESGEHLGAKKAGAAMGFTQNFGPARQNSYARGAAKVAKIMGYPGAGDAQGGKPHTHSGVEIGSGATNELEGVTLSPKKNTATKIYQSKDFTKPLPDTQIKVPSSDGPKNAIVKNYETKNFGSNFNSVDQLKQGGFLGVPAGSGFSSGNPKNQQNRINMLTQFTDFMNEPTSSPRRVTQKLNEMKSGPQGGLISDIKFYGGGKKKHKKKY